MIGSYEPDGYVHEKSTHMLYFCAENNPVDVLGKLEFTLRSGDRNCCVNWVCCKPSQGIGTSLFGTLQRDLSFFNHIDSLSLCCTLGPAEKEETVLRRLRFYFKLGFQPTNIEYGENNQTTLTFSKELRRIA